MTIGPHTFQVTFQVMDIHAEYSCLLRRPWIHVAGEVTSTLHQKLKYVKNGKLVTVYGEHALVVSHFLSFSYINADDNVGTEFQALSIADNNVMRNEASISSLRDVQQVIENGSVEGWEQVMIFPKNKFREGLGFSPDLQELSSRMRSSVLSKKCSATEVLFILLRHKLMLLLKMIPKRIHQAS